MQHAQGSAYLKLRSALVPVTGFASSAWVWILLGGVVFQAPFLVNFALILFSLVVVFSIVTLPVEWDATRRAKLAMVDGGLVTRGEADDAGKVLNAAFLTYIASAVTAILTLLYFLLRFGLLGGDE